jgi:quercetin dioxygenase-like cupin family protein
LDQPNLLRPIAFGSPCNTSNCVPAVAPESDIESVFADTKVEHGQVGQPLRRRAMLVVVSSKTNWAAGSSRTTVAQQTWRTLDKHCPLGKDVLPASRRILFRSLPRGENYERKRISRLRDGVGAIMTLRSIARTTALAAFAALPVLVSAGAASPPRETITPAFREILPNVPGKSLVGIVVSYPPGGTTPAHHHPSSAVVVGYVLSGSIRSQVDGGEVRVFQAGDSWTEKPGAHHNLSENASATEPASLLAIFVTNTGDTELTTLEQQ